MKKLILFFAITILALGANAQIVVDAGTCGDNLTWVLTSDSVLTIGGSGKMDDFGNIDIPIPWYDYRDIVVAIEIGDSVKTIGRWAFHDFSKLTFITIPKQLTTIDHYAFYNCYRLMSATISSSVGLIGDEAFSHCISLGTIILKTISPPIIYENTFKGVSKSAFVHIPCHTTQAYKNSRWGWDTVFTKFIEDCTNVSEIVPNGKLRVYPNPAKNQLTVACRDVINHVSTVEIYDVVGRLYTPLTPLKGGDFTFEGGRGMSEIIIDISHLAKGMYFLKIGNKTARFVKE